MIAHVRRTVAGLVLLTLLVAGRGLAQTPLSPEQLAKIPLTIAEQKEILEETFAKVLNDKKYAGVAAEVRRLDLGSWTDPKRMGTANDIDATLGHPSKRVEQQLVKDINAEIEKHPKIQGRPKHVIKLIHDGDTHFDDLIRGDTGQLFALDYAKNKTPDGLATVRWKAQPDGTFVKESINAPAEAFWHETGKMIPDKITHPEKFLDDAYVIANKAARLLKDPVEQALLYAKHLDNVDGWLLPAMAARYNKDIPLDALKIDEALRRQMSALMDLKKRGLSGDKLREEAAKLLKVDPLKVDEVVNGFMKNAQKYLEESHVVAGYLGAMQRNILNDIKYGPVKKLADLPPSVLNRTLTKARELAGTLGKHLGPTALDAAGRVADVAFLAYQFARQGKLSWDDVGTTILGWGVPKLVLPALLADIGRQLAIGAFNMGVNAFLFDPLINNPLLQKIFDPKYEFWVYGGRPFIDQTPSPFSEVFKFNGKPLNPETLYCASVTPQKADERAEAFRKRMLPLAEQYVQLLRTANSEPMLSEFKDPTTGEISGAGAFRPQLIVDRLVADWSKGELTKRRLTQIEDQENTAVYEPPQMPFLVMVDDVRVGPDLRGALFSKTTKPGQPIEFKLSLRRQFGTERRLQPEVELVAKWCEQGGMEPLRTWLAAHQDDPAVYYYYYEPGKPADVQAEVDARNVAGWKFDARDGGWPLDLGRPFGGRLKAEGPISIVLKAGEMRVTKESSPSRAEVYRLLLTPGTIDTGPVRIDMTFRFTGTFGKEPPKEPETYQMALMGSVEAAPLLTKAAETSPRPNPTANTRTCEADYQSAVARIRSNTSWNYSGLASWSDGCSAADSAFTACMVKTCNKFRDGGIYNSCTDSCQATFRSACTAENLATAAAGRDQCIAGTRALAPPAPRPSAPAPAAVEAAQLAQAKAAAAEAARKAREARQSGAAPAQPPPQPPPPPPVKVSAQPPADQDQINKFNRLKQQGQQAAAEEARRKAEEAERQRIAREQDAERQRVARERDAERQRVAREQDAERQRIAREQEEWRRGAEERDRADQDARHRADAAAQASEKDKADQEARARADSAGRGPAPASTDSGAAEQQIKDRFKAKFGRDMTAAEQQQLIAAMGWTPGQPITPALRDKAFDLIAGYSGSLPSSGGGTTPAPQNPPTKPAGGGTPPATPSPSTKPAAIAKCEADYQSAAAQIRANTSWNYSGLAGWSDGCGVADSAFTVCMEKTCNKLRAGGIYNSCTDGCQATYRSACTAENLVTAAAGRDQCVARAK